MERKHYDLIATSYDDQIVKCSVVNYYCAVPVQSINQSIYLANCATT